MTENSNLPFTAATFQNFLNSQKLMGVKCESCGAIFIPPRAICAECLSENLSWVPLSGKGKLAAYTAVYIGPTFMNELGYDRKNPYLTGIVELEEGVKISARLLGFDENQPEQVAIGTPVVVDFNQIGNEENPKVQLAFRAAP